MIKRTVTLLADPAWFLAVKQWWIVIVAVILLVLAEYVGLVVPLRSGIEKGWQVIIIPTNDLTLKIWGPISWLTTKQSEVEQSVQLRSQYNQALVSLTELDKLRAENDTLKELLANKSTNESMILGVPIMAYGRPLVAAGSEQGVVSGMSVLVSQTLVGVIGDVSRNQATVDLLTQETGPQVLAKTETGVTGIVSGDGKRSIMSEIPIDSKVSPGERVVTQGQAGIQPNILIGTIAEVRVEPSASVQTAVVVQLVSFYESTLVEIQ